MKNQEYIHKILTKANLFRELSVQDKDVLISSIIARTVAC